MAITIPGGLSITTQEPVENRLVLTKAQMLDPDDATLYPRLPSVYFCICSEDKQLYIFSKDYSRDPVLGRFRLYGGGSGSDKHFTYEQSTPADEWEIQHNLNTYPSVQVVDYGKNVIDCEINYKDTNNITVKFFSGGTAQAVSGYAYIN